MIKNIVVLIDFDQSSGVDYDEVDRAVISLGSPGIKFQRTAWLLKTSHTPAEIRHMLRSFCKNKTSLVVIDAGHNEIEVTCHRDSEELQMLKTIWK